MICPGVCQSSPSKIRGRRECRVFGAPAASCATKSTRVRNHRYAETVRHSLRDGFTAYFVLSPVNRALLPPSFVKSSTNLTPASGRQDHTTSPSASNPFVDALTRLSRNVHRILHPTLVTIA